MVSRRIKVLLALGAIGSLFAVSGVQAQPASDAAGSTVGADSSKQAQKAQKKAEKKARREKKNAELKKLEQNGYNPSGDQLRYPQNVQNAEKKANGQGAGAATPASAP